MRSSFLLAIELSISIYGRFKGTRGKIDSCGLRCSLSSWFGVGRKSVLFLELTKNVHFGICTLHINAILKHKVFFLNILFGGT